MISSNLLDVVVTITACVAALTILAAGILWVVHKLARLALTFQGHRHDPLDGFHIADDYPPRPQG